MQMYVERPFASCVYTSCLEEISSEQHFILYPEHTNVAGFSVANAAIEFVLEASCKRVLLFFESKMLFLPWEKLSSAKDVNVGALR